MATKILSRGAVTMTSTWSGGNPVNADDLIVNDEFGPMVGDLSTYSAITAESLRFKAGAIGRFGGGNDGPVLLQINATADSVLELRGTRVKYTLGSDCNNADIGPGNELYITAGTTGTITQDGGRLEVASGGDVTNYYNAGGGETIIKNDGTRGTLFKASAGKHLVEKEFATYDISGTAEVTIDLDDSISVNANTELHTSSSKALTLINAPITKVWGDAGIIDNTKARIDFTLGATTLELLGVKVKESPRVTMTNASSPGGMNRPVSAPIAVVP